MLAAGIADLPEDLAVEQPDLAEYLLEEAALLCRILGSVPFVQLVLELAEQFYQTLPQAVIRALEQGIDQLRSNPALAEVIVAGGSFGEIAMLTGQAWLELKQAAQARASFLTAYATSAAEDKPGLEFLIGNCTAILGERFEAADWAVRSIESAEELGGDESIPISSRARLSSWSPHWESA